MSRTPGPWRVGTFAGMINGVVVESLSIHPPGAEEGAFGPHICLVAPADTTNPEDHDNAAFIVLACNAHERLVESLRELLANDPADTCLHCNLVARTNVLNEVVGPIAHFNDCPTIQKARAVLASLSEDKT